MALKYPSNPVPNPKARATTWRNHAEKLRALGVKPGAKLTEIAALVKGSLKPAEMLAALQPLVGADHLRQIAQMAGLPLPPRI